MLFKGFVYISVFVVLSAIIVAYFSLQTPIFEVDERDGFFAAVFDNSNTDVRLEKVKFKGKEGLILKDDEVLVRMAYATINPYDWKVIEFASRGLSLCRTSTNTRCGVGLDGGGIIEGDFKC